MQRAADRAAEERAARRRGRDALRAAMENAVERMVDTLNYDNAGWHEELGCHDPIRAVILRGPGEHDPDATLAHTVEVHTNAGLALRLRIATAGVQLALERAWLPDGRPLRTRLFDGIERTPDGRDAVLTSGGGRPLSLLAEFEAIAGRVLDPH
jgi:hypothetical protein